jgi:hypothetical protein
MDYYYGLFDSLSENRFYPSNYDALYCLRRRKVLERRIFRDFNYDYFIV